MVVLILQYINISDQYLQFTQHRMLIISQSWAGAGGAERVVQLIPEVHRVILGHKAL